MTARSHSRASDWLDGNNDDAATSSRDMPAFVAGSQPPASAASAATSSASSGRPGPDSDPLWQKLLVVTWNVSAASPECMDLGPLVAEAGNVGFVALCLQEAKNLDMHHLVSEGQRRVVGKVTRSRIANFLMHGPNQDDEDPEIETQDGSRSNRSVASQATFPTEIKPLEIKPSSWEAPLQRTLSQFGDFVLLVRNKLVGLRMMIFVRQELLSIINDVRCGTVACGSAGLGNKGATGCAFAVNGMWVAIVNSHLAAGSGMQMFASEDREKDYKSILTHLAMKPISGERHKKRLNDYDVVIWAGDMNSRLKLSKSVISNVLQKIQSGPNGLNELLSCDEITCWRREGGAFRPFHEAPITFPPTYKYTVGGYEYDVGQSGGVRRVPAWCDRVLFYGPVNCLKYDHCPSFTDSDHKPVVAVLQFHPESRQGL